MLTLVSLFKDGILKCFTVCSGFFKALEEKVVNLLRKTAVTQMLLLTIDGIENIILTLGLELLRWGFNVHNRGVVLGSADRLEHVINVCRAGLAKDSMFDVGGFTDVVRNVITIWNDDEEDKQECLRSHMIHVEVLMYVGQGLNVFQKKHWNGKDLDGMKVTEKELKRKLRVVKCNEDFDIEFETPIFNSENGTYKVSELASKHNDDLGKPLLPVIQGKKTFIK